MIETHAIRLRGPWECQTNNETAKRVEMPAALVAIVGVEYQGRLICLRRFGCPTCLDSHERVWLVIDGLVLSGEAHLNGERLGQIRATEPITEFDITSRLSERNQLVLEFDIAAASAAAPAINAQLFADLRLEIRG